MKEPNLKLVKELLLDLSHLHDHELSDDTVIGHCSKPDAGHGCCLGFDTLQLAAFIGDLNKEMSEAAPDGIPWDISWDVEKFLEDNLDTITLAKLVEKLTAEGL